VARPPTCVEIALAEPTWRDEHLVRLLKERLAKLVLEAPVIGLCLEAPRCSRWRRRTSRCFPSRAAARKTACACWNCWWRAWAPDNVLQALPMADYRPEQANAWVPVQQKVRERARNAQMPPDVLSLPRPTWLLAKPIALLMRDHRPFYGSPLKHGLDPERIEAGWWRPVADARLFHRRGAGPCAVLGVPRAHRGGRGRAALVFAWLVRLILCRVCSISFC
jgi:protein ImuB